MTATLTNIFIKCNFLLILGFTSIDPFTAMSVVSVLMFNFAIITSVEQDQLMMNVVFVLR